MTQTCSSVQLSQYYKLSATTILSKCNLKPLKKNSLWKDINIYKNNCDCTHNMHEVVMQLLQHSCHCNWIIKCLSWMSNIFANSMLSIPAESYESHVYKTHNVMHCITLLEWHVNGFSHVNCFSYYTGNFLFSHNNCS